MELPPLRRPRNSILTESGGDSDTWCQGIEILTARDVELHPHARVGIARHRSDDERHFQWAAGGIGIGGEVVIQAHVAKAAAVAGVGHDHVAAVAVLGHPVDSIRQVVGDSRERTALRLGERVIERVHRTACDIEVVSEQDGRRGWSARERECN